MKVRAIYKPHFVSANSGDVFHPDDAAIQDGFLKLQWDNGNVVAIALDILAGYNVEPEEIE